MGNPSSSFTVSAVPVPALVCRDDMVIATNQALRDLLGYDSDEGLTGQLLTSFVGFASEPLMAPSPDQGCPGLLQTADGRSLPVLWEQEWLPGEHNDRLLIFVADDERLLLWQQLARAEQLTQAGLLAAGIGHEIQNVLTFARLTLEELTPPAHELELVSAHQETITALREIRELVIGLRDVARPQIGSGAPGRLSTAAGRAILLASPTVKSHTQVINDCSEDDALALPEQQLRQVLLNLLLNAGQAIKRGGNPGIIRVTSERQPDALVVRVRDNGPGIAPENETRLFDPHFTTRQDGTGLGLHVSRVMVRAHGGALSLRNHPEGGAIATLTVPLATQPVKALTERRRSSRRTASGIAGVLEAGGQRAPVTLIDFSEQGMRLSGRSVPPLTPGDHITLLLSTGGNDIVQSQLTMVRRAPTASGDDFCFRVLDMPTQSRQTWQTWLASP